MKKTVNEYLFVFGPIFIGIFIVIVLYCIVLLDVVRN